MESLNASECDTNSESSVIRCNVCNYPVVDIDSECIKCKDDENKSIVKNTNKKNNGKSAKETVAKPSANERAKEKIKRGKTRGRARDKKQSQCKF